MRLFVTGTDTGVGKTALTMALALAARERGTVVACKPVASGVALGSAGEDAEAIGRAAGHAPLVFAAFRDPLSPHRAALREGAQLPDDLCARVAALRADTVLVEGVGGWRVPLGLDPPLWVSDLARATGGPVVVVAADRLGTLNHTLLTLEAIRADGLRVACVVLNRGVGDPGDLSRESNSDDLSRLAAAPVVVLPPLDPGRTDEVRARGASVLRVIVGEGAER